ncbi:hypothetical protein BLNAU_8446 [Blattamonas nauphoetae]|uniref:Calcineurin-like phosphoesterase domain-containing protein n=1 Tax=Blattamonas nauphoetae TaxID=2049346 RepID=A0ABQ9XYQ7_9EUKA|nr:hypothetical protein BLNAU_8446 [Blattamonas nauphoetae]
MPSCCRQFCSVFGSILANLVLILLLCYPFGRSLSFLMYKQLQENPYLWFVPGAVSLALAILGISSHYLTSFFQYSVTRVLFSIGIDFFFTSLKIAIPVMIEEVVFLFCKAARPYQPLSSALVLSFGFFWFIVGHIQGRFRRVKKINVLNNRIPQSLRVVQLSDIHIGSMRFTELRKIVNQTNQLNPDIICITGDLVDSVSIVNSELPDPITGQLRPHCGFAPLADLRANYGVFFVTGNHDVESGRDGLLQILSHFPNITVLSNEIHTINIPIDTQHVQRLPTPIPEAEEMDSPPSSPTPAPVNFPVRIIGIEDGSDAEFREWVSDLEKELPKDESVHPFTIVLHHRPHTFSWKPSIKGLFGDMMLCGHTHAGQVWPVYPFILLAHVPAFGMLQKARIVSKESKSNLAAHSETMFNKRMVTVTPHEPLDLCTPPFIYVNPGTCTWASRMRTISLNEITCFDVRTPH